VLSIASSSFPVAFDNGVSSARLVLLVSPTCPLCLAGVDLVVDALDTPEGGRCDTHVLWLPVLETDNGDSAANAARAIGALPRITQYWDESRAVSTAAHTVLDFATRRRNVAWDVYLFYRAGARWTEPIPSPDHWLHQLDIADQPSLSKATLRDGLRMVSSTPRTAVEEFP
jgi:hypothetical protein